MARLILYYIMWWVASLAKQHLSAVRAKLSCDRIDGHTDAFFDIPPTTVPLYKHRDAEGKHSPGFCTQTFQFQPGLQMPPAVDGGWCYGMVASDQTCESSTFVATPQAADIGSSVKTPGQLVGQDVCCQTLTSNSGSGLFSLAKSLTMQKLKHWKLLCASSLLRWALSCQKVRLLNQVSIKWIHILLSVAKNKRLNPKLSSWWFQALWKICSSNWESSSIFGVKIKNIWNHLDRIHGWLIGILIMVFYNPYITGWYNPLITQLWKFKALNICNSNTCTKPKLAAHLILSSLVPPWPASNTSRNQHIWESLSTSLGLTDLGSFEFRMFSDN